MSARPERRELLALAGLLVLAAALRLPTLGLQSFWYDEANTALIALEPGLGDVLDEVRKRETSPPLYYVVLWGWAKVFGSGDAAMRSLSALAGLATVAVAWLIGRRLASPRVGLVAGALVATSPLLVKYSQENRPYSLLVLLGALSFLLFLRTLDRPSPGRLGAWAVVGALGIATHYFAAFLVGVEAVWLLARVKARRRVIAATAGAAIVGAALLPLAVEQRNAGRANWITDTALHERVRETAHQFSKGVVFTPGVGLGLLAVALVLTGGILLARAGPSERRAGGLALAVGLAAAGVPAVLAIAGLDVFFYRNLLASFVPLAVGLAIGFGARRSGAVGLGAAAALSAAWVAINIAIFSDEGYHRDDWKAASAALGAPRELRAVLLRPSWVGAAIQRYGHYTAGSPRGGLATRELVLVGNLQIAAAPARLPRLPGFRLVERRQLQKLGLVRYRSRRPTVVRPKAFGTLGSGLRFELGPPPGST